VSSPSYDVNPLIQTRLLTVTVGVASGYFICYGSIRLKSSLSWRLPFIVQAVASLILALGMEALPFSPRWLIQVGRTDEAFAVLESFDRAGAEKEKAEILAKADVNQKEATLVEIFSDSATKWRTILGIFLMGMQVREF